MECVLYNSFLNIGLFFCFFCQDYTNYWLLQGQSKYAVIEQIWNHAESLFTWNKYAVCLMFVLKKVDFVAYECLRVKLSESKTVRSNPHLPLLLQINSFYATEDDLLWFAGVSFDMDTRPFLEDREPNQKHCGCKTFLCAQMSESILVCFDCWQRKGSSAVQQCTYTHIYTII